MNDDQKRFFRVIAAMENEGDAEPLAPELADKLAGHVLGARDRQRSRRRRWAMVSVMAAAAGFALFVGLKQASDPLPAYQVYVSAGEQFLGSAPPTPTAQTSLTVDSVLRLELRPQSEVRDAAYVKSFLHQSSGLQPLAFSFTRLPSGSFRVQAPLRAVPALHPGQIELIFAIGRSAEGPEPSKLARAVQSGHAMTADGWQILRQPLKITP